MEQLILAFFSAYPVVMDYFVKAINQLFSALVDKNKALADMENLEFLYEESDMEDEEDHVPVFFSIDPFRACFVWI